MKIATAEYKEALLHGDSVLGLLHCTRQLAWEALGWERRTIHLLASDSGEGKGITIDHFAAIETF